LGWRVTTTKHTGMVTDALRQALQVRRRGEHDWVAAGLIHHSDSEYERAGCLRAS
jgi:hypothetical protein